MSEVLNFKLKYFNLLLSFKLEDELNQYSEDKQCICLGNLILIFTIKVIAMSFHLSKIVSDLRVRL